MKRLKKVLVYIIAVLTASMMVAVDSTYAASFSPSFSVVKNGDPTTARTDRPITYEDYLNCQGIAFDTYTGNDGYSFNQGTAGSSAFQLVHFRFADNGSIVKEGYKTYAKKNVGHANDATIYRDKNDNKYIFVAISGGKEKSSRDFNGKKIKLGVIWMDEYENGIKKVRGCKVKVKKGVKMSNKISKCAFSGIAYTGDRKNKPVFVLKDGRTFYAAHLKLSKSRAATLTIFDSARIKKPTFKYKSKKYDASTQGVTYHNGYLYLSYSGESKKVLNNRMMITRISYKSLFKGKYSKVKKMKIKSYKYGKYKKHIPEAIFFKKLNGKDNMFVSINRATNASTGSDTDCVIRSSQKY